MTNQPTPWRYSTRGIAIRLFLTCWLIYGLHFATNIVREIYPALALGDHFSFRVDDYANMHPDLFEKPGYGWHIGANPGASMVAAIPYALARPVIDRVVERVKQGRQASGQAEPPAYNSPWPMAREFFKESWRRGFDIKFGLAAMVMQVFCMAPSSALGVVAIFYLLRLLLGSDRKAFWMAVIYAFGTPVFFRTGYLNHNLMLGHIAFLGFVTMWNAGENPRLSTARRYFLGGVAGGAAVLFDYSGAVLLLGLFAYGLLKQYGKMSLIELAKVGTWYVAGTLGPVGLLWFYQWRSFGHPFLPGQHWMPPVEWIELGYQGAGLPQWELLGLLLFDYRYGLFVTCPLFLLALAAPYVNRGKERAVPRLELWTMLLVAAGMIVFFSGINYTRLQFNTGIRYLAPIFPFLFVPASLVLARRPRRLVYFIGIFSVALGWCMAMYRDVERGLGVVDPILRVMVGGFQLPALTTLSRMGGKWAEVVELGVSPLPLFALTAAVLFGLWHRGKAGAQSWS